MSAAARPRQYALFARLPEGGRWVGNAAWPGEFPHSHPGPDRAQRFATEDEAAAAAERLRARTAAPAAAPGIEVRAVRAWSAGHDPRDGAAGTVCAACGAMARYGDEYGRRAAFGSWRCPGRAARFRPALPGAPLRHAPRDHAPPDPRADPRLEPRLAACCGRTLPASRLAGAPGTNGRTHVTCLQCLAWIGAWLPPPPRGVREALDRAYPEPAWLPAEAA